MKIRWYEVLILGMTALCVLMFLGNFWMTTHTAGIWITTERGGVSGELSEQDLSEDDSQDNSLVDINTAGQEELEALPGVGPVKAAAILEYRRDNGLFQSTEELLNVEGIGEKLLEKISGYITVSTEN